MKQLSDKEIESLGFTLKPMVTDECSDGFSYRVAEIKTTTSFIEIINEYRDGDVTEQFCNYEIIEEGNRNVDVELIKKLKKVMKL